MSDDSGAYLDVLLGAREDITSAEEEWAKVIQEWEESRRSTSSSSPTPSIHSEDLLRPTPWPHLSDFYAEPPQYGEPSSSSRSPPGGYESSPKGSASPPEEQSNARVSTALRLWDRLRSHLTSPSRLSSFEHLIASKRDNDDIQSELVENLGFEGDGLALTQEVLGPGVRQELVQLLEDRTSDSAGGDVNGFGYASGQQSGSHTPFQNGTPRAPAGAGPGQGRGQGGKVKGKKNHKVNITDIIGSAEEIERRLQEQLAKPQAMFSEDGRRIVEEEQLPYVFKSTSGMVTAALSQGGRFALPAGTVRELNDTFEEVTVPPSNPIPPRVGERPFKIAEFPPLARGCFKNYVTLNRMQSVVRPIAMDTNENMLVCAPTGAGKTDVALMSILRVISLHTDSEPSTHPSGFNVDRNAFKVIYVAPMKALAAEITRKFGKRLAWLGIKVRELTGDMQLTRQEIAETQIIVTTPEKWDVVTRKPTGEGELVSKVKLLIIDEVHLLNEDRGAVIETIVARTLRLVESSQSLIRIVGLSATLPNYIDVSDFLRVNRYQGLFFFDASFRPVPLEQHFIGIAGKPRSQQSIRNMDQVVFDKVAEMVQNGHQVMVFVHARKETVSTAKKLREMVQEEGMTTFFDPSDHPKFQYYRREIGASRNKEMKDLFDGGFGIHHAGMLRSDRNMMEKMFEDQAIRVLCCTSTLAWGVNLPAHAVVIKGTQVYDSNRAAFVDLSVLDVLQIFGRAGRPGYETSGVGYICTTQDKLDHYLDTIMAQHPIESKFIPGMVDALNAEIALGTISNVQEAIQWLGYTYLFVRMRKEPFVYGMPHDELKDDPQLGNKRNALVIQACRQLESAQMARLDLTSRTFIISDIGRIAAKYYLRHQTLEIFNSLFHPKMRNADLFSMLSQATEFEQIRIRENEVHELSAIMETEEYCPLEVKGGLSGATGKVNVLLQAHISQVHLEDFALVAEAAYVAQNAARIIRALLEISLSRNWANCAKLIIDLSKAIEQRMWPYEHPLAQISTLHKDTLHNLRRWADDVEISVLRNTEPKELGELIHMNETHGAAVRDAARALPTVGLDYALRPLSNDLVELQVTVRPVFTFNSRISPDSEPFYIWVQDDTDINILQWRSILIRQDTTEVPITFVLSFTHDPPAHLKLVAMSDRWLGSDYETFISLDSLIMPPAAPTVSRVLDIPYLQMSCLQDKELEERYSPFVWTLTGIQTQTFWSIYHTNENVLLSAPVASGKSFLGEMAIWSTLRTNSLATVLILLPSSAVVDRIVNRLRSACPKNRQISIVGLPSKGGSTSLSLKDDYANIVIATSSSFLDLDNDVCLSYLSRLSLVVLKDLHLLDAEYEVAIMKVLSTCRATRARIVGLTACLSDPSDLAIWLKVNERYRYHFDPRDRGAPLSVAIKTFTIAHSAALLRAMVKPTYDALKQMASSVIIFVPSPAACRAIAGDLVKQSGTEMDLNGFLKAAREDVEPFLQRLRDPSLLEPVLHGIGYLTPRMAPSDQATILDLFASSIIKALIVSREAAWTLPIRADNVIIMGAQYHQLSDVSSSGQRSERRVLNYTRAELVKMQSMAITSAMPTSTSNASTGSRVFVLCQAEQQSSISRTLSEGLPLESSLHSLIQRIPSTQPLGQSSWTAIQARLQASLPDREPPPRPVQNGRANGHALDLRMRDMMDLIGWSFLALRIKSNPTYYTMYPGHEDEGVSRMIDEWFKGNEGGPPFDRLGNHRGGTTSNSSTATPAELEQK